MLFGDLSGLAFGNFGYRGLSLSLMLTLRYELCNCKEVTIFLPYNIKLVLFKKFIKKERKDGVKWFDL